MKGNYVSPIVRPLAGLILAVLALAGCGTARAHTQAAASSAAANPAAMKMVSAAETKGIAHLKSCLQANGGTPMITEVVAGTATLHTYRQMAQTFKPSNLPGVEHACLGSHPVQGAAAKLLACEHKTVYPAVLTAVQPLMAHPWRNHAEILQVGAQTALGASAVCLEQVAP